MVNIMPKTAFLFPGQGAQYVGMGKDFYEQFNEAQKIFNQANEILGFDIAKLCFEGKQEELNKTAVCQPAILITSLAILEVLKNHSPLMINDCRAAAGLSLGEYTAHAFSGSMTFSDAVRLVYKRGTFMQEACTMNPGGMVSIIGLKDEVVENLCKETETSGVVCAANYNSPGQVVISGEKPLLDKVSALAKERGAKMVVPLKVEGAFHSHLMSPAGNKLSRELDLTPIARPNIPVVANVHAKYVKEPEEIRTSLAKQLNSPVRWHQSIHTLINDGFNQFYEIGPGKTLTGLMKRIDSTKKIQYIDSIESLKSLSHSN
jgi:[acyl-carrier-protein] S-malonyltransferase